MFTSPAHSRERPKRSLALRVLRNIALGSITGVALMLFAYSQQDPGSVGPSTHVTLGPALAAGVLLGPVMSLMIMATRNWRTDVVGHYASWGVAGVVAGLVVGGWLMLDDPTSPALALGFGAFLVLCSGIGFGAVSRYLYEVDRSTRD